MALKPSIPKGTRDFSPGEVIIRDYIFSTIRDVFRLYGYQPIETPAMENLSTLLGKYGNEGDKLLFRILNSGDFLAEISESELYNTDSATLSARICEKGLRYDLTVPFARYVVQHRHEITFPFKRYQIQPVWRADKPQKGRYREFFQCDADVIGSNSLLNEFELIKIIDDVFVRLKIPVIIRINNRKILAGIAELAGGTERLNDITVAIDKLEKIGTEAVRDELLIKGIPTEAVDLIMEIIEMQGSGYEKVNRLKELFGYSETGQKGIEEIETILGYIKTDPLQSEVEFDLSLARGLDYYTGIIIEVKASQFEIGSICGGGRYDNLTGIFGLENVSGIGISFGADRIYDIVSRQEGFSETNSAPSKVLVINFGNETLHYALKILKLLHTKGISAQLYPDAIKVGKQFAYASALKIPFVIVAGDDEINFGEVTVKNMNTGTQTRIKLEKLCEFINE